MQLSKLDWDYVQKRAAHFTGRGWVFARLDQFFRQPPGAFLVLGEPGTGKTAIAAQLALAAAGRLAPAAAVAAPHWVVPIAAAYFCRSGSVDLLDIAQRLSDQLADAVPGFAQARQATLLPEIHVGDVQVRTGNIAVGGSVIGVHIDLSCLEAEAAFVRAVTLPLKRVREAGEIGLIMLMVDALDESLASETAKVLPQLLGEVEHVHLLVTSRPDHRATGGFLEHAKHMDILADAPPGSDDVLDYLQRRLTPEGAPAAMMALSQRIAAQANGNFLYAFYAVEELRRDNVLAGLSAVDACQVQLHTGGLPGVYRDFLRRMLWRDDRAWSVRFAPVLAPLAVAQDEGLTTEQLRLIADQLSQEPMSRTMVRDVTRTARQFLDGPVPDGPFRIYHQSFADFLVDPGQNPDFVIDAAETHNAIVKAYAATDPLTWDDYGRRNLALHAAEASQLDRMLEDARFLLVAEPSRLWPHLDAARSAPAQAAVTVYRQSAHLYFSLDPDQRRGILAVDAARYNDTALLVAASAGLARKPRWATGSQVTKALYATLTGHTQFVDAIACTVLEGRDVAVSVDGLSARVWDLATGRQVATLASLQSQNNRHTGDAVACTQLEGHVIAITGGVEPQLWDVATQRHRELPGLVSSAAFTMMNGNAVAVIQGNSLEAGFWLQVLDVATSDQISSISLNDRSSGVLSLACTELSGRAIAVTGHVSGTAIVWDLATGQELRTL